ncbi:MAG: asparagine--tRNA ligase, partial [Verrucomicrobiae bacterium]|nr:asparagine--tRNA ligase [Verrucomicrobiae bacterium]
MAALHGLIRGLLNATEAHEGVTARGWVRTRREGKGFSFLELNDGSCLANLQVIVDDGAPGSEALPDFQTGASVEVTGDL